MTLPRLAPIAAVSLIALGTLPALADHHEKGETPLAAAEFRTQAMGEAGTANLSEGPEGVVIRVNVEGLTPGWHAIHFHGVGDCSDAAYKNSGSHVQHGETEPHGLLNPEGPDDGDLANIHAAEDGTVNAELYSARVTLSGADGRANLLDADGSALVIHEGPDDHMSQPIGGAGARVACAVIEKVE
ncbi:superoxide dismutase family protein [Parvibaculum sp.]|jgi:Cu-Zn family superoxide dismutase|uniref:superoxide dismutase family protein n=1 Tax=Parvibaculum sp. TaxID=2024848 RepID=UPI001B0BA785|nr:superoxide dismutase family protein [Parvibaculum sp.]MBO6632941.1 superoxide dismutase family protein [Parvibaculum sp.]MBO6677719.1 superoxide dismutase family protein [Parvibaculum sp.]MBO6685129.1 superoxide dismutase family protein [Parvibaculum sp.]MBO6903360.1 superoxide dismutase family protein [Parvibaculum sp.]